MAATEQLFNVRERKRFERHDIWERIAENGTISAAVMVFAAIAAVRPAGSHIFFPVKGHGTVAAVPCPDRDSGLIDERSCHGCTSYCDLFKEFLILPILSENLPHVKSGGVLLKLPVYKNQKAEESVAPWGRLCYTGFAIKCSAKRGAVRWRT